jgi:hypothetical protein
MYSSPRDMARFLAANLGALGEQPELQAAMALAQEGVFQVNPRFTQGLDPGARLAAGEERRSPHRRQERRPQTTPRPMSA